MKSLYVFTRDLHLYFGLFISPFILVYAISILFLVHAWIPGASQRPNVRIVQGVELPEFVYTSNGRDQVEAIRPVLDNLRLAGEINFVRRVSEEHRLVVPVLIPGRETTVDLKFETHTAVITERSTGIWDSLVYLHKMPGPHNANIRGNSLYVRLWRWVADATVYVIMFLSLSGIYLWAVLRADRRIGLALIAGGALSFFGIVYALAR